MTPRSMFHRLGIYEATFATVILSALFISAGAARGQTTPFYKDKTIRIIVGFTSGGLYDQYARLLARYMGKHIPGNPTIIVQNMPGAGGIIATNYVSGVAKPDGLTLGMIGSGIYLDQLLGVKEAQYDVEIRGRHP
jgi:tripartite-type tricarboxylate transporter receptor subunit TctC